MMTPYHISLSELKASSILDMKFGILLRSTIKSFVSVRTLPRYQRMKAAHIVC